MRAGLVAEPVPGVTDQMVIADIEIQNLNDLLLGVLANNVYSCERYRGIERYREVNINKDIADIAGIAVIADIADIADVADIAGIAGMYSRYSRYS